MPYVTQSALGEKPTTTMFLTRALSSLGMQEMGPDFSAYSIESNSGFIVIKSFIVLCNEDTKHLVEITVF